MLKAYVYLQSRAYRIKDEGATAVEYGLMVALIAVAIIAGVTLLGTNLNDMFDRIAKRLAGKG